MYQRSFAIWALSSPLFQSPRVNVFSYQLVGCVPTFSLTPNLTVGTVWNYDDLLAFPKYQEDEALVVATVIFSHFPRTTACQLTWVRLWSAVMGFQNHYNRTSGMRSATSRSMINNLGEDGPACSVFKVHSLLRTPGLDKNRERQRSSHRINCTYYANTLHLNCNHNRQGPSGSDDRCQPLIINVNSEESAVPAARLHSGLDSFHPDTGQHLFSH